MCKRFDKVKMNQHRTSPTQSLEAYVHSTQRRLKMQLANIWAFSNYHLQTHSPISGHTVWPSWEGAGSKS